MEKEVKKIIFEAIGSDPEVFLLDKNTGEHVPSFLFIEGNKENAFNLGDDVTVLCDNVMLEYTTRPAATADEFIENNKIAISKVMELIPENVVFAKDVFVEMNPKYLDNDIARTFGCSPDFNAYTLNTNVPPEPSATGRSAGGHIHVSWSDPTIEQQINIVKALDLFLGLPMMSLDTDTRRKEMYGKAGCYRDKPYGIEYRVLSSFWVHDNEIMHFIFNAVKEAIKFVNMGTKLTRAEWSTIRKCIDQNDLMTSEVLMKKYNVCQYQSEVAKKATL